MMPVLMGDVGIRLDEGTGRGVIGDAGVAMAPADGLVSSRCGMGAGSLLTPVTGRATIRPVLSMLAGRCAGR